MSEEHAEVPGPSEEDMRAVLTGVAHRLAQELVGQGVYDAATLRERITAVLASEDAAGKLLGVAWADGVEQGIATHAEEVGTTVPGPRGDPRWADVQSPGERKMLVKEQHLCLRCDKAPVCVVARAIPPELLTVVARCLAFFEVKR